MEQITCVTCDESRPSFRWTDTHGVAVCNRCGTPYRLFHYDEDDKRVEKPPTVCLNDDGVQIARRYWAEAHRMVYPGCYDMGIMRGSSSYSGATEDDAEAFGKWYEQHYPGKDALSDEPESDPARPMPLEPGKA